MKNLVKNEIKEVNGGVEIVRYKIKDKQDELGKAQSFLLFSKLATSAQQQEIAKILKPVMVDINSKTSYTVSKETEVVSQ